MRAPSQSSLFFPTVTVIGVGLLGGSLARELFSRKLCDTIVGFGRSRENLLYAQRNGIISHVGHDLTSALALSDLVIWATPVRTLKAQIAGHAKQIRPEVLVIDVGSTKRTIAQTADRYFPNGNFVGCHPMAGGETSGASASRLGMFVDKPCVVTPSSKTRAGFTAKAKKLWQALGAHVSVMTPLAHDKLLAQTSHLPQVVATALMTTVAKNIPHATLRKVIGNGFRDTTRIAASDAVMWTDIALENRDHLKVAIKGLQDELAKFGKALNKADARTLENYFKTAAEQRKKI